MAFTLSSSVVERNDNKLLTITDTTGEVSTGSPDGWQVGTPGRDYTTIVAVGGAHTLELAIKITTSDGTETTYDDIDLYTVFGPFAAISDLVFPLDCSMLAVSGTALGTIDDEFPDGIYEIAYVFDQTLGTETQTISDMIVYGKVKNSVYELSRTIPSNYECGLPHEKETLDILFMNMYLNAILRSGLAGREASVLADLYTLERLVTNVSTYNW